MKKIKIFIMIVLGMVMMVGNTSCVSYTMANSDTVTGIAGGKTAVRYYGSGYTKTGVLLQGERYVPTAIIMKDMRIVRKGTVVFIQDGDGNQVKSFDTRLFDQAIKEVYFAIALNGNPIEVTIEIHGPHRRNCVIIKDGTYSDYFSLRRE